MIINIDLTEILYKLNYFKVKKKKNTGIIYKNVKMNKEYIYLRKRKKKLKIDM